MMNPEIKLILTKVERGLKKIYGQQLDQVILYGSQARGDAKPESDIDILIVLKKAFNFSEENERIDLFIADLCLEYNTLISCAFATRQRYQNYDNSFFRNVRREGLTRVHLNFVKTQKSNALRQQATGKRQEGVQKDSENLTDFLSPPTPL